MGRALLMRLPTVVATGVLFAISVVETWRVARTQEG